MEELDAVDWYDQRVDATQDEELRAILAHNRDAAMVLERPRRHDARFDEQLRTYLFTNTPILEVEEDAEGQAGPAAVHEGSLGIGGLRGKVRS